ncbi:OmpA family protein [Polaribacter sp. NJDZ03]|uniref:OmpA family protein n=1 Tax=Polaribacter sp. NJDZ03 TaxID=2855841 RepID=UPI001C4A1F31|nr:OmpA family protein [Polaribacter sp. NJDZ03]
MNSIKYISISFLLLGSLTMSYAQQNDADNSNKSMVIMSEDDILSLTKTLRLYKKAKTLQKNSKEQLIKGTDTIFTQQTESNFEFDYLKSRVAALENRLNNQNNSTERNNTSSSESSGLKNLKLEVNQLRQSLLQRQSNNGKSNVVYLPVIAPVNRNKEEANKVEEEKDSINSLVVQQQQDSLYEGVTVLNEQVKTDSINNLEALELEIQALKKEISLNKALPSTYEKLVEAYKNFKKELYFATNSKVLNENSLLVVKDLHAILEANVNLDIIINGFASNKGNAIYNENLSMQRTEAVKKALMLKGVHPTRILTQYHGIDYSAQSDSQARRVEVSFLVRK